METQFVLPVAASLVAIAALFTAVVHTRSLRQHHRLTVVPHLYLHRELSLDRPNIMITLSNTGLGPAVLDNYSVYVDKEVTPIRAATDWYPVLSSLGVRFENVNAAVLEKGDMIGAGRQLPLLTVDLSTGENNFHELQKLVERIRIKVKYASVYGDRYDTLLVHSAT